MKVLFIIDLDKKEITKREFKSYEDRRKFIQDNFNEFGIDNKCYSFCEIEAHEFLYPETFTED